MALRIITLAGIKANSRIDGTDEDNLITSMGEAAEQGVLNILDRSYDDIIVEYGAIPAPITQACLALTDHLYHHRGITNPTALYNIPYTIDFMVKPYIKY